jgi:hypothetical protein
MGFFIEFSSHLSECSGVLGEVVQNKNFYFIWHIVGLAGGCDVV